MSKTFRIRTQARSQSNVLLTQPLRQHVNSALIHHFMCEFSVQIISNTVFPKEGFVSYYSYTGPSLHTGVVRL